MSKADVKHQKMWDKFRQTAQLSDHQLQQFKTYCDMLLLENENINLTAITNIPGVIRHHFLDSLALRDLVDMSTISVIGDVGTGAGFPGLALKIKYPELNVLLIEMNSKRRKFLQDVCEKLGLDGVQLCEYDWRTFVRKTEGAIDLFTARASLSPKELIRVLKSSSGYPDAKVIYWASKQWECESGDKPFYESEMSYKIGSRERKLVVFSPKK